MFLYFTDKKGKLVQGDIQRFLSKMRKFHLYKIIIKIKPWIFYSYITYFTEFILYKFNAR